MALERFLDTSLVDSHFFDDMFDEATREVARMHHDMRAAMQRLTPPDILSGGSDSLTSQLELSKNPIVKRDDGSEEFQLQFDVGTFKPDEIKVKATGRELNVEAKHEEKRDNARVFHHFSRHYVVPEGVDMESLSSTLSKDGVLTVRGPCSADNALEGPPAKKPALEQEKTE